MEKCRICNRDQFKTLLSDYKTSFNEIYSLKQCLICSFVSTDPVPNQEQLNKYYNEEYWQKPGCLSQGLLGLFYKIRVYNIIKYLKKNASESDQILDWGAGDGSFVNLLNKTNFNCLGIDLYNKSYQNKNLINTTIENSNFNHEQFKAIVCLHVLEHLYNPKKSLEKAVELLKPEGILIIELPNINSLGYKLFKKKWQPLQIPIHLNHFNLKSLKYLIKAYNNLKIEKVKYFSHKTSSSALVLSLFPIFTPKRIRKTYQGKYPKHLLIIYMLLQIIVYPFTAFEALIKKGSIIQLYIKKNNG
ncbi:class I SAM-dependent methyltransferase [Patescibacteria group bacterium AH-259-L05]|nr:class I SAM-dependent methyltransferase [Patescibacteria group bacterium AH-259-L05]